MSFQKPEVRGQRSEGAFSLVEVTLALGITAFCLLALFGLLPVGLTSNQNAIEQTAAAGIATGIFADLRATPATSSTSVRYGIGIPTSGTATHVLFLREDGTAAGGQDTDANGNQNPRYRATMTFTAPGSSLKTATKVRLLLTWPALADTKAATAPANYTGSFEVVSTLDRN